MPKIKNLHQPTFVENKGQVISDKGEAINNVLAKASVQGLDLYLTKTGASYVLLQYVEDKDAPVHPVYTNERKYKISYSRVDVELTGAQISKAQMQFEDEAGFKSSYYTSGKEIGGVNHYKTIRIANVYPGIDWVWKVNTAGKLEYDFVVHPNGNVADIAMKYNYADITPNGNQLSIGTHSGKIIEGPLQASVPTGNVKIDYVFNVANKTISFKPANYDRNKDLLIDPPLSLQWSAQYGGTFADGFRGVATDTAGFIYLVGYSQSTNYPAINAGNGSYFDGQLGGTSDAIVMKIDSNQLLKWSTYFGGAGNDFGNSITVDSSNNVYVTGGADVGFPLKTLGGAYNQSTNGGAQDAFIARFNDTLALKWSTYYGGAGNEEGLKVITNKYRELYVCGYSNSPSPSFPTYNGNGGYFQSQVIGDEAFILKFDANGQRWWATMYGGAGNDYATSIAIDSANHFVVCGYTTSTNLPTTNTTGPYYHQTTNAGGTDGFILRFDDYDQRQSAAYYGGSGEDFINDVAIGKNGSYVFTGRTSSTNFPIDSLGGFAYNNTHLTGNFDAFIIRMRNDAALQWSTYYGGTGLDVGTAVVCDAKGRIYVTGFTFSTNFPLDSPTFAGAFYQSHNGGLSDGFLAGFSYLGVRFWSTYRGDTCYEYPADIAFSEKTNKFYVCGEGLLNCASIPDSSVVHNGGGLGPDGFVWAFQGHATVTSGGGGGGGGDGDDCFGLGISMNAQPCPGQCNGIGTVNISGGVSPYITVWNNGQTTATDSTLCDGEIWVEVQDASGCVQEFSEYTNPVHVTFVDTGVACYAPGSATAIGLGGNPGYTYHWADGTNTAHDGPLYTGDMTYVVTITDARNCTAIGYANVPWINYDLEIVVVKAPSCHGSDGVLALVNIVGSDSFPVSGDWFCDWGCPPVSGSVFNNAQVGHYSISGVVGCYEGQPYSPQLDVHDSIYYAVYISNDQNVTSCVDSNGVASIYVDYSQDTNYPYTYLWNDSTTDYQNTHLGTGEYDVTVTDAAGCSASFQEYMYGPAPIYTIYNATSYLNCALDSSAYIDQQYISGGVPPYQYLWSTGDSSISLDHITAGQYSLTITDAGQCSATQSWNISYPGMLYLGFTTIDNTCNGGSTGSATVNVITNFGNSPYSYSYHWDNGQNTQTAYGLTAGTYSVTVKGNGGATQVACVNIYEPSVTYSVSINNDPVDCQFGNAAHAVVTGGTPPYTISWSDFEVGPDAYTPQFGYLDVYVYDQNNCYTTTEQFVVIAQPFNVTLNQYDSVDCNTGGSTIIDIEATGGVPNYYNTGSQVWPEGTYTISVYDSYSCSQDVTFTVAHHEPLSATYTATPILCYGDQSTVDIEATGGYPQYTNVGTTYQPAGSYSVTVYDSAGCSTVLNYDITQPDQMIPTYTATDILCNGGTSDVTIDVTGGTGPFYTGTGTYSYTAGTYTVPIYDYNGCEADETFTITEPPLLVANYTLDPLPCNGTSTNVTIYGSGGTSPYYGEGVYTANIGNNDFTISDNNGCTAEANFTITQPDTFIVDYTATPIICNGGQSTIQITATGGTQPYSGDGTFYETAGSYIFTVIDNSGCSTDLSINLTEPTAINVSYTASDILCNGGQSSIDISATGGQSPYSGTGTFTTGAGSYIYPVIDNLGCEVDLPVTITEPDLLVANYTAQPFPCGGTSTLVNISGSGGTGNYTGTGDYTAYAGFNDFTISDDNGCIADVNFTLTAPDSFVANYTLAPVICNGGQGTLDIEATGGTQPYNGTGIYNVGAGTYTYTISDNGGCSTDVTVTVTEPPVLNVNYTAGTILCNGGQTTVDITATGGVAPYTGVTTYTVGAGSYTYSVIDSLGCQVDVPVTISEPTLLSGSYTATSIACNGGASQLTVSASGGTSPYSGTGTYTVNAGTYNYPITDNNGCTANVPVTITEPAVLQANVTTTPILCYGGNSTVVVSATGGTQPYTGTGTFNVPAGTYPYTVTDNNGCITNTLANILQPAPLVLNVHVTDTFRCFVDTIHAVVTANGGTPPYTGVGNWSFSPNSNNDIVVTDDNGCTVDSLMTLQFNLDSVHTFVSSDSICMHDQVALQAGSIYNYTWYPGHSHNPVYIVTNLVNDTTVYVTGTGPDGCRATDTFNIHVRICEDGIVELRENNVSIYPNPATDRFVVQLDQPTTKAGEIELYTVEGKLVMQDELGAGENRKEIYCGNYASAIYVIHVKYDGNNYYTKMVVDR